MDNNNFDQLGFPVNDDGNEDFGATREMNSIHDADGTGEYHDIAPRDRFTELNSADEPGSTRMMDSIQEPTPPNAEYPGKTKPGTEAQKNQKEKAPIQPH